LARSRGARESDVRRLDAAESGLEWGAALLKARAVGPLASWRQRRETALRGEKARSKGAHIERKSGDGPAPASRAPEPDAATMWDCSIAGGGEDLQIRLADPASRRLVWSCRGSASQVASAFEAWLVLQFAAHDLRR